jgi:hypothetical protein
MRNAIQMNQTGRDRSLMRQLSETHERHDS